MCAVPEESTSHPVMKTHAHDGSDEKDCTRRTLYVYNVRVTVNDRTPLQATLPLLSMYHHSTLLPVLAECTVL